MYQKLISIKRILVKSCPETHKLYLFKPESITFAATLIMAYLVPVLARAAICYFKSKTDLFFQLGSNDEPVMRWKS